MALNAKQYAYLKQLAKGGDRVSQAIIDMMGDEPLGAGTEKIVYLVNPAAAVADAIVASVQDNAANALTVALATLPHARNVTCTFGASWAGGDITVVGTDQFGRSQTEVIADTAGSTIAGVKIFKTITSVTKQSTGAGGAGHTVTVGTGDKLGLGVNVQNRFGTLLTNSVTLEAFTTVLTIGGSAYNIIDDTNDGFEPTTKPNGTHDYLVLCRV